VKDNTANLTLKAKLNTGMAPSYVRNWTTTEAIRELLQNYLDVRSDQKVSGFIEYDSHSDKKSFDNEHSELQPVVIRDYGSGLKLKHLALGISEKSDEAIGRFGKGLKQAFLVLAREDRNLVITTNDFIAIPAIEFSNDYQTETLFLNLYERQGKREINGTKVSFDATSDEMLKARKYFVEFIKQDEAKFEQVSQNLSLPAGRVFINNSYVGNLGNALFSYHLKHIDSEKYQILSSDRDMINAERFRKYLQNQFGDNEEFVTQDYAKALIEALANNSGAMETEMYIYALSKTAIRRLTKEIKAHPSFGIATILAGSDKVNVECRYRGKKPVYISYGWRGVFRQCGFPDAEDWLKAQMKDEKPKVISFNDLTLTEQDNLLDVIKAINEEIFPLVSNDANYRAEAVYLSLENVLVSRNLIDQISDSPIGQIDGMADLKENTIYIDRDVLKRWNRVYEVVLHEYVHLFTKAQDNTEYFTQGWQFISACMLSALRSISGVNESYRRENRG